MVHCSVYSQRLVGSLAMLDSLRIEKRFLHYGHDFSPMESVLQVGLGFACKINTGDCHKLGSVRFEFLLRHRFHW